MGIATAALIGATVASGYMANQSAKKGAKAQSDAANAMRDAFNGIPIPTIEEQKIILQNPQLVGEYTPEQVQAMQLGVSAMEGVQADQGTVDAQNSALEGIGEVAKGGFTQGDLAASREAQKMVSRDGEARRASILNQMASRGVLGSGSELAAQLQGAQQSADQMSSNSNNLVSQAQNRALSALSSQGSLAGQMNAQQFGQRADKARATDAINQFNTQNSQNIANQNVTNRNQAQQYNLGNRQALEGQRTANANQQEVHNKGLAQTQFANQMGKESQVQQANMAAAQAAANQANANAAMWQGFGSAAVGGISGFASKNAADEAAKKGK